METLAPDTEVRLAVSRCLRTLATSTDPDGTVAALQTLHLYLDDGAEGGVSSAQRAEFRRAHFTRTLQLLVSHMQADGPAGLTAAQRTQLWDGLFLKGPPEQALMVLMEAMGELR
ncbi:Telomere length regulation protein TEL2 [Liparis tanakae]|uniref:Telomere length regulation protein TEL2 n=1 Tax=Liparis tanakae TaxID=230148 RepID=A0A4Z2E1R3_9TELE|nr:Telomere length regulation protein TEL2 [Liparis tanakae]